ncbi:hypothetical protein ACIQMV_08930 [Streptomyces sp. NPDC091412]|uniref:hypothetical protein n=1 Tax=Streptomyces sp. NPDC091412 TaxID=3366002 RepID=UPI0037FEADCB
MSELFGISVIDGGAVGLLAFVFLYVVTGKLVPRRTYNDLLAERDYWRAAHAEEVRARQDERALTTELLEVARTADHVLASLPPPRREEVTTGAPTNQPAHPQP